METEMHGLETMTREELLELAPLDAFGLLDEVEAALFHRAFHQAPAAVQAEVIALQAELAEAEHFLADEEPRPILRRKVFLRLEELIDESAEGLRPIAQIGSRGSDVEADPATLATEGRHDPESLAAFRALMEEFADRNARAAARTTPFWRAAAIVLATALVVSLTMLGQTSGHARQISELVISQGVEQQIGTLVPNLAAYAAPGDRTYAMVPASGEHVGLASVLVLADPARGKVVLTGFGLGRIGQGTYSLRAISIDGVSTEILRIDADRFLAGEAGTMPDGFVPVRYELVGPDGAVAFSAET